MPEPQMLGAPIDVAILIIYMIAVVAFGAYFGKYASSTRDFFFGGQRFAWWLIAFSGIATTVGSYSFIKYSEAGYKYGLSSTQSYLNDWFWIPILLFLWLPVIYFNRIQSVPEYFERRFGRPARALAILFIMFYLVAYVGINLLTLGQALNTFIGWDIFYGACIAALIVTVYCVTGGQTSVIMTDLVQGLTLLIVGIGIFIGGVLYVGGFVDFWALLPTEHRHIFSRFSEPDEFSFIGIYGQDGLANTGAFILMNQGMIMRFLAIRTVKDARKMAIFWILVLYPLAAITVAGGGWIAKALVVRGDLVFAEEQGAKDAFILAAHFLCQPGVFGFVLAALMAALMSTADTLINAVSAVFINDIYRPYIAKDKPDQHYLRVARISSLTVAAIGLVLVIFYQNFESIYQAHAFITAAIPPPVVAAILLGLLWKGYNLPGAVATLLGGGVLIFISTLSPWDAYLLGPLSFGMGPASYTFTRAFFGLVASGALGVLVAAFTKSQDPATLVGLVNGTQLDAMRMFKGGEPNRRDGKPAYAAVQPDASLEGQEVALVPASALETMAADVGDLLYVCDRRWWFGGLRSIHTRLGGISPDDTIRVSPSAMKNGHFKPGEAVYAEKIF